MFERFTKDAREAVRRAETEARRLGATRIEAEHLLLAVAADTGLEHERVVAALATERRASLAAVGVEIEPPPVAERRGRIGFGTSAKRALERALKAAVRLSDRRIESRHLALGVMAAEAGTVPRALALTDVDVDELRRRLEAAPVR